MEGTNTLDPVVAEVKAGLARRGFTQQDLAQQLGYSRTAVGNRLNGSVPFNLNELRKTAVFLGIPFESLLVAA
jgi:transcriptional regulator with XRE-family HTH domain